MTVLLRALVVLAALLVVSCSRSEEPSADVVPADDAVAAIEDGATVVDVRTPEEYAAGHLPGARNIDVTASDFEQQIDGLARDDSYVVYCRTGNRSAAAVETMLEAGFDDVVNGGGYDDLVAAGAA
jgi:phage shock protein E